MIQTETAIVVRQGAASDALELAELRFASLVEMGMLEPDAAAGFIRRTTAALDRLFAADRLAAWLLIADGRPAGCACVVFWDRLPFPSTSLHAEICGVYIIPKLRRHGFASELVAEAVATAKGRGVRKIVLSPTAAGREMYRRLGFQDENQMTIRPPVAGV